MFKTILQKDQKDLKAFCAYELRKYFKSVQNRKKFIYCKGELPVLLVAHLDTVHKELPTSLFLDNEQNIMWSPQGIGGDDRCGIFSIFSLLKKGLRPHVLFTTDEEIGGVGASAFAGSKIPLKGVKYLIELDRRGEDDMVFYDCGNEAFQTYVGTFGFKEAYGSYSDISTISPAYDIASVNLSIGYYNEHSSSEFININHMAATILKVEAMLKDIANVTEPFDYQVVEWGYGSYYSSYLKDKKGEIGKWWDDFGYPTEEDYEDEKELYGGYKKTKAVTKVR